MEEKYFVTAYERKCPFPCEFLDEKSQRCLSDKKTPVQPVGLYGDLSSVIFQETCSKQHCPVIELKPFARLSVGSLTPEEKIAVEERLALADGVCLPYHYALHAIDDAEMGDEHNLLCDRFDQDREHHGNIDYSESYVYAMLRCADTAERIRKVLRTPSAQVSTTIAKPKFQKKEKKEVQGMPLDLRGKYFNEYMEEETVTLSRIAKEYGYDRKTVASDIDAYRMKNGLPPQNRKPGRPKK